MEVIELNGYIEEEKIAIAQRYLLPRQLDQHGLTTKTLKVSKGALRRIISAYTREAGVRGTRESGGQDLPEDGGPHHQGRGAHR